MIPDDDGGPGGGHEVTAALRLVEAIGRTVGSGADTRLAVRRPLPDVTDLLGEVTNRPYVVVHPGASVPSRAASPTRIRGFVAALLDDGWSGGDHRQPAREAPDRRGLSAGSRRPRRSDRSGRARSRPRFRRLRGRRQHRARPSGRGGGNAGGLALRTGGPGRALGSLGRADSRPRRPEGTVSTVPRPDLPGARSSMPGHDRSSRRRRRRATPGRRPDALPGSSRWRDEDRDGVGARQPARRVGGRRRRRPERPRCRARRSPRPARAPHHRLHPARGPDRRGARERLARRRGRARPGRPADGAAEGRAPART